MGRPSKLTPQLTKRICKALEQGLPIETACTLAGISYESFNGWRKAGEAEESEGYVQFLQSINEANAKAEELLVERILSAAKKHKVVTAKRTKARVKGKLVTIKEEVNISAEWDWRASAWLLTHAPRFKHSYADRVETVLSWEEELKAVGVDPEKFVDALADKVIESDATAK